MLSIYHIVLLAICTTQVKKKRKKEKKKNKVTKNLHQGYSNPDPPNTLGLKMKAFIHWTTSVRGIYSFSMVIDSFQGWLFRFPCRIESLTDLGKNVNLTINPWILFQAWYMPGTLKRFMSYRSRGYRLNSTILSLLVRCLFISRGKHLAQHCLSLFPLF